MRPRKTLERILAGSRNVRFQDMVSLAVAFGFRHVRTSGSHFIFSRAGVRELINLQEVAGQAKPYQVRQFMRLVEKYNLQLTDE